MFVYENVWTESIQSDNIVESNDESFSLRSPNNDAGEVLSTFTLIREVQFIIIKFLVNSNSSDVAKFDRF